MRTGTKYHRKTVRERHGTSPAQAQKLYSVSSPFRNAVIRCAANYLASCTVLGVVVLPLTAKQLFCLELGSRFNCLFTGLC